MKRLKFFKNMFQLIGVKLAQNSTFILKFENIITVIVVVLNNGLAFDFLFPGRFGSTGQLPCAWPLCIRCLVLRILISRLRWQIFHFGFNFSWKWLPSEWRGIILGGVLKSKSKFCLNISPRPDCFLLQNLKSQRTNSVPQKLWTSGSLPPISWPLSAIWNRPALFWNKCTIFMNRWGRSNYRMIIPLLIPLVHSGRVWSTR